jgi:hypothetical protein
MESEKVIRKRIKDFTDNVTLCEVPLAMKTDDSEAVGGIVVKPSPMAFVEQLCDFILAYISKLDKYDLCTWSLKYCPLFHVRENWVGMVQWEIKTLWP